MRRRDILTTVRTIAALATVAGAVIAPPAATAHENHAPLPTKGVKIAGDTIMLSDKAREAIGLTTAKVGLADLHRTVEVNARVELPWQQQAMITSLVPGKIDQVLVRPGETVAPGQELARVVSMELESLQLALLEAGSETSLARRLVEQRTGLDQQGVIAGKSLLDAQANLAGRLAALEIARQKLLALGLDQETIGEVERTGKPIRHVSIVSPIGGIITHADVRTGQVVTPTDHLYHVVDPSMLWIVGEVLESDVRHLEKGQSVEATFAASPDRHFPGTIDHVRLKMDRQRRTQSVVIAVTNREGLLRPGMFGRVQISVHVAKDAIVCPVDAVIRSRTGTYVLVERKPGKYESRPARLGLKQDGHVEVLGGAFPGDQVVVVGNSLLASLLGNEHKARVRAAQSPGESEKPQLPITVAHATVELPTDRQALATSRVEGRIRRILVEPSQQVRAGQVLAEVDSLRLREVQLDFLQTLTQARLTDQSLKRLEELGASGVTPQRRLWELQNEAEQLGHRLASLKRQLNFFGLTDEEIDSLERLDLTAGPPGDALLGGVPVRAPRDGWIVGFHVVPGQVVDPQNHLFEIHDLSAVWVKGYVYERDSGRVKLGQTARVAFAAYPDLEATGSVVRIAPMMDENQRVLPVWVEVANPDRLLKEGMLARVTVLAGSVGESGQPADVAQLRPIETRK